MTKFTINPRVVYSGDSCYVTIAAFIVISQSIYLLTHLGARSSTMSCSTCFWGLKGGGGVHPPAPPAGSDTANAPDCTKLHSFLKDCLPHPLLHPSLKGVHPPAPRWIRYCECTRLHQITLFLKRFWERTPRP